MAKKMKSKSDRKHTTERNIENLHLSGHFSNLTDHPDYKRLIAHYEKAEFAECQQLLEKLDNIYPHNGELSKIKEDLKMKLSLRDLTANSQKREKFLKFRSILNILIMIIVGIVVGISITYASQVINLNQAEINETEQDNSAALSLESQAEQLLLVGNPETAQEILDRLQEIDPGNDRLPELSEQTKKLQQQKENYQSALDLQDSGSLEEALKILQDIEREQPGLWDVNQQIAGIETALAIKSLIEQGKLAFESENWVGVIAAYEQVMESNPAIEDQQIKEQLFGSYLNQIILMLQAENTSIIEINQAADYYRKAVALFPQSREFADEREDLRELSSGLLELKYKQIAENLLADPYQDQGTVGEAVAYLRKAAKIQPNNSALQLDLQNVEYYQIAFNDFLDMNWRQAITNFEKIIEVDPNFADGNAKVMLFESYYLLGEQYYSAGFFQDALSNLEKAELLIWEDRNDNLIRLFLTEVLIGKTLGAMEEYENAVSYFRYATNMINVYGRLIGNVNLSNRYLEANDLFAAENYQAAFDTYNILLDNIDSIYSMREIEVETSMVLALFADANRSTVKAIIVTNDLPKKMTIKRGQVVIVPSLDN